MHVDININIPNLQTDLCLATDFTIANASIIISSYCMISQHSTHTASLTFSKLLATQALNL